MNTKTLGDYFVEHSRNNPDRLWLRERNGDQFTNWTWRKAAEEVVAVASWLEQKYNRQTTNIALLSRNRAHWFFADFAIIMSGNVSVPMFTTLSKSHAEYILDFADVKLLFLGETMNWHDVRTVLPEDVEIVTLPGVECDLPHTKWDDIVALYDGATLEYQADYDDLISIVFTSGTTGVPKGALQSHRSMLAPVRRIHTKVDLPGNARAFSYLPLAHIAERQLVEFYAIVYAAEVTFNESLETLVRDLNEARPDYLFGAPRVWEQLQQGVIASFGSAEKMAAAMAGDREAIASKIRENLGLQNAKWLISGAAPAPPAMLEWYAELGLSVVEGYGQTEAMGLIGSTATEIRSGSIGKPIEGVEVLIGENDELLIRADGLSPGYYKRPEKTAELWQDGWLHTGDKARIDEDGFIFLSGRVKDYFKTIHGKFVAPAPVENHFAGCAVVGQVCLLGRGYSKTVMVCVLADHATAMEKNAVESEIREQISAVNEDLYHHARIGAVLLTKEPWTIENGMLTPTLKIRRDEVESVFGAKAEPLARRAAESHQELVEWV